MHLHRNTLTSHLLVEQYYDQYYVPMKEAHLNVNGDGAGEALQVGPVLQPDEPSDGLCRLQQPQRQIRGLAQPLLHPHLHPQLPRPGLQLLPQHSLKGTEDDTERGE